jgi:NADH-quinone oxidoreductase subunit H
MFFIAEYTSMITVSCLCSIMFFGGWLSPFPASWTFTHYLPSAILIPFGLWVIWDGIRYETLFGRIILPGVGTAFAALGAVFALLPDVNHFIQGPFWLLSKILVFLFVYVWMRGTLPRFRYDQLMAFGWKLLLPLSIVNVIVTSFVILAKMTWWGAK